MSGYPHYNRGQGLHKRGSKRGVCPQCGKKGMTQWKPVGLPNVPPTLIRDCQYCGHSESRRVGEETGGQP